jgi:hypothetical protein
MPHVHRGCRRASHSLDQPAPTVAHLVPAPQVSFRFQHRFNLERVGRFRQWPNMPQGAAHKWGLLPFYAIVCAGVYDLHHSRGSENQLASVVRPAPPAPFTTFPDGFTSFPDILRIQPSRGPGPVRFPSLPSPPPPRRRRSTNQPINESTDSRHCPGRTLIARRCAKVGGTPWRSGQEETG